MQAFLNTASSRFKYQSSWNFSYSRVITLISMIQRSFFVIYVYLVMHVNGTMVMYACTESKSFWVQKYQLNLALLKKSKNNIYKINRVQKQHIASLDINNEKRKNSNNGKI